jgi:hypothetical protein
LLVVLELVATFDGGSLSTESSFQMLSFLRQESQGQAVAFAAALFVALGFVLILSLWQISGVVQSALAGHEWSYGDLVDVAFDVGQVVAIVYYGITVLDVILNAEVRSGQLVQGQPDLGRVLLGLSVTACMACPNGWFADKKIATPGLVDVPFVAPDVTPDKKFADFFKARADMDGCVPPLCLV